jgi:hypothetical protein
MEALLRELYKEREAMEQAIFEHAPTEWAEFQKRLGEWIATTNVIQKIEGKIQEKDNE